MKQIVLIFCFVNFLFAQRIEINNFTADIFNKKQDVISISMSLVIEGRYLKESIYKINDALNSVIANVFYEKLITSYGKINFKKTLKNYTTKHYSIDIDDIYIQKLHRTIGYSKLKDHNVSF